MSAKMFLQLYCAEKQPNIEISIPNQITIYQNKDHIAILYGTDIFCSFKKMSKFSIIYNRLKNIELSNEHMKIYGSDQAINLNAEYIKTSMCCILYNIYNYNISLSNYTFKRVAINDYRYKLMYNENNMAYMLPVILKFPKYKNTAVEKLVSIVKKHPQLMEKYGGAISTASIGNTVILLFEEFLQSKNLPLIVDESKVISVEINVFYQLYMIHTKLGMAHCDLHENNVLTRIVNKTPVVYKFSDNDIYCFNDPVNIQYTFIDYEKAVFHEQSVMRHLPGFTSVQNFEEYAKQDYIDLINTIKLKYSKSGIISNRLDTMLLMLNEHPFDILKCLRIVYSDVSYLCGFDRLHSKYILHNATRTIDFSTNIVEYMKNPKIIELDENEYDCAHIIDILRESADK